jgi:hypothetical protein
VSACGQCGARVEASFRFCPYCAAPQRRKVVEYFRGDPHDGAKALRVSWYVDGDPHVRVSVWDEEGVATSAISLDERETHRLAAFLARTSLHSRSLRDRLASFVR